MTQPADSDQIAKAREQLKERLEAFAGQWIASRTVYDDFEMTVDFAASERQAVIEDCCRAVCVNCKDTENLYAPVFYADEGLWKHRVKEGRGGGYFTCDAAAIRSME